MSNSVIESVMPPLLVRHAEAARLVGVSARQLYLMREAGEFNVPRVAITPHTKGFRVADLQRWVATLPETE